MARTKGAKNKQKILPILTLSEQEKLSLIADLLVELIVEEQSGARS